MLPGPQRFRLRLTIILKIKATFKVLNFCYNTLKRPEFPIEDVAIGQGGIWDSPQN